MDVMCNNYRTGDSGLVDKLVSELKSQGIFDQFRKECISDVDTKPAYQNLRQRVEGSVASFLNQQTWNVDLNKNQLREQLRKKLHESGFLETGVERIVDQVVNPKINTIFLPKVKDVVYRFLGIAQPSQNVENEEKKDEVTNLQPCNLKEVSLDSEKVSKNETTEVSDPIESSTEKMDEDESPPFEPLENQSVVPKPMVQPEFRMHTDDNSRDSSFSGFSGLHSHESNPSCDPKLCQMDLSNQGSLNSSETRLSIVTSEETTKMEVNEDSNLDTKIKEAVDDTKLNNEKYFKMEHKDGKKSEDQEKKNKIPEKKHDKSEDHKLRTPEKSSSRSKDDKHRKSSSSSSKDKEKSKRSSYSDSSKDKDSAKKSTKSSSSQKHRDRSRDRRERSRERSDKSRDRSRSERDKDKSSKHKDKNDSKTDKEKYKTDKYKTEKNEKEKTEKEKSKTDKEKSTSSRDKESKDKEKYKNEKDKNTKEKEKYKDKTDKDKSSRKDKDKEKNSSDKSYRDKNASSNESKDKSKKSSSKDSSRDRDSNKEKNDTKSKDKKRESDSVLPKEKSSSSNNSKENVKPEETHSKSSDKNKKDEGKHTSSSSKKDSKKKSKDDHYSLKVKKNDRRSTDRDSNDGSSKRTSTNTFPESSSSQSESTSQDYSNSSFSGGSGDSGNSDQPSTNALTEMEVENISTNSVEVEHIPKVKYMKPKFALNFQEARKIMKIRKQLAKLERQNQLSLANIDLPFENGIVLNNIGSSTEIKIGSDTSVSEEKQNNHLEKGKTNKEVKANKVVDIIDHSESKIKEKETDSEPDKPDTFIFNSADISHENFLALESKLAEVMSKINYNTYDSDEDYEFLGYRPEDIVVDPVTEKNFEKVKNEEKLLYQQLEINKQSDVEQLDKKHCIKINFAHLSPRSSTDESVKSLNLENTECYYLMKPSEYELKNLNYLKEYITNFLKAMERFDNVSDDPKRGQKRKLDDFAVNKNHNISDYMETEKKRKLTTSSNLQANQKNIADITLAENFPLPLSPAESDKSTDRKEEDLLIPIKQKKLLRGYSQRYSSEDLYKPRPVIGRRTKCSRDTNVNF